MFTKQDASVFNLPGSFEKTDELGNVYFPQLGALLLKANELILKIYGINVYESYKASQTPMNSKGRRKEAVFKETRNLTNQVIVGLRGKGKPTNLFRSDGKPSDMHFAYLGFSVGYDDDTAKLLIGFEPYILKYAQSNREVFSEAVDKLDLEKNVGVTEYYFNKKAETLSDLLRIHKSLVVSQSYSGIDPKNEELAFLVVIFVAMFPLLDVFTKLSNGEDLEVNYTELFQAWLTKDLESFRSHFTVEPLKAETANISEAFVRNQFESLLGKKFPATRPVWLRSAKTKANLELDGYCEDMKLAFEYQGEYHYVYVPIHHQGRSLEEVQANDAFKAKVCQEKGVDLIQVPYWERNNSLFIIESLRNLGRDDINGLLNPG